MKKRKKEGAQTHKKQAMTGIFINKFTEAPENQAFILSDGRLLKNLKDLADSLEHMDDGVFTHHVSESKNDFSNWLGEVLSENELAEDLHGIKSRSQAQMLVLKHIAKKSFWS